MFQQRKSKFFKIHFLLPSKTISVKILDFHVFGAKSYSKIIVDPVVLGICFYSILMQNFVIDRNIRFVPKFPRNEITLLAHIINTLESRLYGTPRAISGHFGQKTRFKQSFSEISKKISVLPTQIGYFGQ